MVRQDRRVVAIGGITQNTIIGIPARSPRRHAQGDPMSEESRQCEWCGERKSWGLSSGVLICHTPSCNLPRVIKFHHDYRKSAEAFMNLRGHTLQCESEGEGRCFCGHSTDRATLHHNLSWAKAHVDAVIEHAEGE